MASKFVISAKLILLPPKNLKKLSRQIQKDLGAITGKVDLTTTKKSIAAVKKQVSRDLVGLKAKVALTADSNSVRSLKKELKDLSSTVATINDKPIRRTNETIRRTAKDTQKAVKGIEGFGKASALAIRRFGAFVTATFAIRSFVRFVREAFGEAIKFERELVKIAQVQDRSLSSLTNLTNEVARLSRQFGVSSAKLLNSARVLSQAGLAASEVRISLEALAKSDLAPTFEDITQTTEGAIAIMRQFKLEAKDLEGALGAINAVSSKFAVESGDIIQAVRRTGGVFEAAGGNLQEFIALFTAVRATTRESAQTIAVGLRTIVTRIQRVRTINFLKTFGIDLTKGGQFIGPIKAFRELSRALKDLPTTDPRFARIAEEIGGFRQIGKTIPLIKSFGTALDALAVAETGQTSLTKDAVKAQQTLAVQLTKVREEFLKLIRDITNDTTFKSLANLVLRLSRTFIGLAESLKPIGGLIAAIAPFAVGRVAGRFFGGKQGFLRTITDPTQKFQTGGQVGGTGRGDRVPALLEPGEFVLNRKAVRNVGISNLQKINKGGISRFQTGGTVTKAGFNVGGRQVGFGTAALGVGVIGQFITTFKDLDSETKNVIDSISGVAIQFALLTNTLKIIGDIPAFKNLSQRIPGSVGFRSADFLAERQGLRDTGRNAKRQQRTFEGNIAGIDLQLKKLRTNTAGVVEGLNERERQLRSGIGQRRLQRDLQLEVASQNPLADPVADAVNRDLISQKFDDQINADKQKIAQISRERQTLLNRSSKKESVLINEQLRAERGVRNSIRQRRVAVKKRQVLQEQAARRDRFSRGASVAIQGTAILGLLGSDFLSQRGQNQIASTGGGSGRGSFVAGGTIGGVSQGALIGSIFGPWGAAIGAATGGLIGFFNATSEATKAIEKAKFAQTITDLQDITESIQRGRNPQSNITGLRIAGESIFSRISSAEGEDLSQAIQARKQFTTTTKTILDRVAETSGSLNEFKQIIGEDLLNRFSTLSGKALPEVIKSFEEQIKNANKRRQIDETSLRAFTALNRRLRDIVLFSSAVRDAADDVNRFSSVVESFSSFAGGGLGSTGLPNFGGGFNINQNPAIFGRSVSRITSILGPQSQQLGAEANAANRVITSLPNILVGIGRRNPLGAGGRDQFIQVLEDELKESLRGGPKDLNKIIRDIVISNAEKAVLGEGEADIRKLLADPLKAAEKLIPDQFKQIADALGKSNDAFQNQLNILVSRLNELVQIEDRIISINDKRLSNAQQFGELTDRFFNRSFNAGRAGAFDLERQRNILGARNQGLANQPLQIENALFDSQKRLVDINKELANNQELSKNQIADLIKERSEEQSNINRLNKALTFLSDASARSAAAQKKLEEIEKSRAAKASFASDFLFGDLATQRRTTRAIQGATFLSQGGGINNIPPNFLSDIRSVLRQFQDVPIFGGKTGRQVEASALERLGIPRAITRPGESTAAQTQLQEIRNAFVRADQASLELRRNTTDNLNKFITSLNTEFNQFIAKLEKALLDDIQARRDSVKAQQDIEKAQIAGFNQNRRLIASFTGVQAGPQTNFGALAAVPKQLEQRQNITRRLSNITALQSRISSDAAFRRAFLENTGALSFKAPTPNKALARAQQLAAQTNVALSETDISRLREAIKSAQDAFVKANQTAKINPFAAPVTGRDFIRSRVLQDQSFRDIFSDSTSAKNLRQQLSDLNKSFEDLGVSAKNLNAGQLKQLAEAIKVIASFNGKAPEPVKRAGGGPIGSVVAGFGTGDRVPALLEPGEFVIRKRAAQALGTSNLNRMNNARGRQLGIDEKIDLFTRTMPSNTFISTRAGVFRVRDLQNPSVRQLLQIYGFRRGGRVTRLGAARNQLRKSQAARAARARQRLATENQDRILSEFPTIGNLFNDFNAGGTAAPLPGGISLLPQAPDLSNLGALKIGQRSPVINNVPAAPTRNRRQQINTAATTGNTGGASGGNTNLSAALNKFATNGNALTQALNNFPREVQHTFSGNLEVIINGAEVLTRILPEVQQLVEARVKDGINRMIQQKFPQVGRLD